MSRVGTPDLTTVDRLRILFTTLVLASLCVGAVVAWSVHSRVQALHSMATNGQLTVAAEELHRSLAGLDVAAASAFLARDRGFVAERVHLDAGYEANVGQAHTGLANLVAAGDVEDETRDSVLGTMPGRILEYSTLAQSGVGYSRQRSPVAATYQLLASDSMRHQLLPAAAALHRGEADRVTHDGDRATRLPGAEIPALLLMLACIVLAQLYLGRQCNRVFNVGLLVATTAAIAALLWVTAATITAAAHTKTAHQDGAEHVDVLSSAQIVALTARASEALFLIAGTSGHDTAGHESDFDEFSGQLLGTEATAGMLENAILATDDAVVRAEVRAAAAELQHWLSTHERMREADEVGRRTRAAQLLISSGSVSTFEAAHAHLDTAIETARQRFDHNTAAATSAWTGVRSGVLLLSVLMAAGSAFGIRQRLEEYR